MTRPAQAGTIRGMDTRTHPPVRELSAIDYGMLSTLTGFALRRAQLAFYQDLCPILASRSMTPPLFAALVLIDANRGLNQTRLAQALGIARSGAMTIIDRLEGLVERRTVPKDRRRHELVLTERGQAVLHELIPLVALADRRSSKALPDTDTQLLRRLLEAILPARSV